MKTSIVSILFFAFGVISAEYVGPQNGNGNGNAYGVPTDSITPPQPQGGPYPPSGWKPAGPRLLLPGEARSAQQPNGNGFGQSPPSQYGPVNPVPSGPSVDNQYGPAPPNQYIPGSGFGNGNGGNGHGSNGNGGNGNGHNGNGHNGNGHNGNGHNGGNGGNGNGGNGHNGSNGGNGNGHNGGNGFGNGNGNGNGNGHNGNNGHSGNGNGFTSPGNGNGFSNGNGNGGNGFGSGTNGNGHNGNGNGNGAANGNGNKNGNGGNGFSPAFHGGFPGVVYPFIQHSVPAVLALRPGNGAGHGSIYPLYQVSTSPSQSGSGVIDPSLFSLAGAYPSFQNSLEGSALGAVHPGIVLAGTHQVASTQPAVAVQGTGLIGHRLEPYYTFLTNHQSQKSQLEGLKNGLSNLQLQYTISQPTHGNLGVPVSVF